MNAQINLLTQQLNQSRQSEKLYKQTIIKMARASLKQIPREDLIELLVKRKIIQRNWAKKGVKYKLNNG